jgi:hypothetical protein
MTQTFTATYSPDDNKIRLYASSRLDSETYARVKAAGFRWAPKQDLFFTTWSPRAEGRPFEDHLLPRPRQEGFRQRARRGEGYGGPDGTQAALRLMRKLLKKQGFAPKLLHGAEMAESRSAPCDGACTYKSSRVYYARRIRVCAYLSDGHRRGYSRLVWKGK